MDQNVIKNKEKTHDIIVKNRRKLPEVRQTLTSKYRMLKANPLLMHELGKKLGTNGVEDFSFKPLKALVTVLDNKNATDVICKPKPETKKFQERLESREPRKLLPTKNVNLMHNKPPSSTVKSTKSSCHLEHSVSDVSLAGENVTHIKTSATNFTPSSSNRIDHNKPIKKRNVPFVTNSQELSRRLSKWLQQRGKDFGEYHHLKCFGLNEQNKKLMVCDTEKENLEPKLVNSSSHDTLEINALLNQDENDSDNLSGVAQDALLDLQKLILEGYPPEQCQVWLKIIKQKYRHLEEEPQYWECRAALEQSRGNINSAVECYKTAIIHGAEVQSVDKHLDQLLYKFSLLNISKEASFAKNDRTKIVKDARNIFKSSIIQFAVQERISRRKNKGEVRIEKTLIATPVRRSTRLSRCAFTSTPGIQLFSSLQDIDNSVRNTLNFQCNNALKD